MAHWSGIGIPKTNAIALEVSYTHDHGLGELKSDMTRSNRMERCSSVRKSACCIFFRFQEEVCI